MAKATKKVVKRRRERKVVEKGAAHIRSSFNNTMVTITDLEGNALPTWRATLCPGLPPAVWASVAPVSPLPLLPRLLLRLLPRLQSRAAA